MCTVSHEDSGALGNDQSKARGHDPPCSIRIGEDGFLEDFEDNFIYQY